MVEEGGRALGVEVEERGEGEGVREGEGGARRRDGRVCGEMRRVKNVEVEVDGPRVMRG